LKLVSLSMIKNEEYWIWYSLTAVHPHVDEILVFDNHSEDRTLAILRGMDHVRDKLTVVEGFGGESEHENRTMMLAMARDRGATHALWLDGDEVYPDETLDFCRRLYEVTEHQPALADPPRNPRRPMDPTPSDGILVKNLALRPLCPGFDGPDTCRPLDYMQADGDHTAYNYLTRFTALEGLQSNGLEWGDHGFLEADGTYIQASPHTLWMPRLWYWHFQYHPRSSRREANTGQWTRPVVDHGSLAMHEHVHVPRALLRPDGPSNPTLGRWGLRLDAAVAHC